MKYITTITDKQTGITTRWFDARPFVATPKNGWSDSDCLICDDADGTVYVNWVINGAIFGIDTNQSLQDQFEQIKKSWKIEEDDIRLGVTIGNKSFTDIPSPIIVAIGKSGPAFDVDHHEPTDELQEIADSYEKDW